MVARPVISPATIDRLRALDERAMPSTCRVLRRAVARSGGRTVMGDSAVVAGPVVCRLGRTGSGSRGEAVLGRPSDEPPAVIELPQGTEVRDLDWIEVTTTLPAAAGPIDQVITVEVQGDPWSGDYDTNLMAFVWRQDERYAG